MMDPSETAAAAVDLNYDRLNEVVTTLKRAMANEEMRKLGQRAIQAKLWHLEPKLASYMIDLRRHEESVKHEIFTRMSHLIHQFHERTIDATLARAGLAKDRRIRRGSALDKSCGFLDLACLDSKERLYLILLRMGWLEGFHRLYPQHFYENSVQFVENIPPKKLPVKVKVVGLGIAGSLAVSGLAKVGIESVVGYEKRSRRGPRSATSRYQNASWRAYDIAEKLLDEEGFQHLVAFRQRINVTLDDGTSQVVTSDRVQIILGAAIDSALDSASRYGAELNFEAHTEEFYNSESINENVVEDAKVEKDGETDIVALFCGAHTSEVFPGLKDELQIMAWPELTSIGTMWLRIKESEKREAFTARSIGIGAENWHFTIASARKTPQDIQRIRDNLVAKHAMTIKRMQEEKSGEDDVDAISQKFEEQLKQIDAVMKTMLDSKDEDTRFDYIFTNAPDNEHNRSKREAVAGDGSVVIDGNYQVDVKIANNAAIDEESAMTQVGKDLLKQFSSKVIVTGGDACVPPNPLAAYGATLACESADALVNLAVAHGHLNAIVNVVEEVDGIEGAVPTWIDDVKELKTLFTHYYNCHIRSENYFQFVQTIICNLYSLPCIDE